MRRHRNMAQMKEHEKTPIKELNKTEITNLSDAELKTLVIGILRELPEYGKHIEKEMKVITLSEIKKNLQGTNNGEDKPRIKSMIWNIRKEKAFNQNSRKEKEFKKQTNKKPQDQLRNPGTTLNVPTSES